VPGRSRDDEHPPRPRPRSATIRGVSDGAAAPAAPAGSSTAELFVLGLSTLSIVNIVLLILPLTEAAHEVILIVDLLICLVLLVDFYVRFRRGGRAYFFGDRGWLDLIGSLPAPGLRFARIFRMVKVSRGLHGGGLRGLVHDFQANLAQGALLVILFLVILVLEFGGVLVVAAEGRAPDPNIVSGSDALWWGIVTITTVGYGDRYPTSNAGRIVGVFVLLTGVALFATITGYIANSFLSPKSEAADAAPTTGDPVAAGLADIGRLVDDQERTIASLRTRLAELERAHAQPPA
jgi:voltage-gated potassium channel